MLTYRGVEFKTERGSISITYQRVGVEYHYEGTDDSDFFQTGIKSTIITCNILAITDGQKNHLRQFTLRPGSGILILGNEYYKDVIASLNGQATPYTYDIKKEWSYPLKFTALDPYAYNVDTEEVVF